jgi:hypothetical protein
MLGCSLMLGCAQVSFVRRHQGFDKYQICILLVFIISTVIWFVMTVDYTNIIMIGMIQWAVSFGVVLSTFVYGIGRRYWWRRGYISSKLGEMNV